MNGLKENIVMISANKIRNTFLTGREYPAGILCLASIIRLYNETDADCLLKQWKQQQKNSVTLAEMKSLAIDLNFDANVRIMTVEQLNKLCTPAILLFMNELGKCDFVVCYGLRGKRFVVWEPSFGWMQYEPEEVECMWVRGMALVVLPFFLNFYFSNKINEKKYSSPELLD